MCSKGLINLRFIFLFALPIYLLVVQHVNISAVSGSYKYNSRMMCSRISEGATSSGSDNAFLLNKAFANALNGAAGVLYYHMASEGYNKMASYIDSRTSILSSPTKECNYS